MVILLQFQMGKSNTCPCNCTQSLWGQNRFEDWMLYFVFGNLGKYLGNFCKTQNFSSSIYSWLKCKSIAWTCKTKISREIWILWIINSFCFFFSSLIRTYQQFRQRGLIHRLHAWQRIIWLQLIIYIVARNESPHIYIYIFASKMCITRTIINT